MRFEELYYALFFLMIPLLVWRVIYIINWKVKTRKLFSEIPLHSLHFGSTSNKKFIINNILIISAIVLVILALMNLYIRQRHKEKPNNNSPTSGIRQTNQNQPLLTP